MSIAKWAATVLSRAMYNTYTCRRCGQPIIFRPYIRDPKTDKLRRPRNARVFAIHLLGGGCETQLTLALAA